VVYKISKEIAMAELAIAGLGGALVVAALAANQRWLDHHFLPSFFFARRAYVLTENVARAVIALTGVLLALVLRRRLARGLVRNPSVALYTVLAVGLALGASEVVIRHMHVHAAEWLSAEEEPRRQADPLLGWRIVPSRAGRAVIAGREIEYAFDAEGHRVRRLGERVDTRAPTILFTGESVMLGYGLEWAESVPAQVASITGVQSANAAVNGFSTDQAYLRLREDLPRFRRPVATVTLFMSALFGRNLDDDRPHLGPELEWMSGVHRTRLMWLTRFLVPYRSSELVESGIAMTQAVLRATNDLAQRHGATPILLVPQLGPEDDLERTLRRRVLDDAGLPYVYVQLDPEWRLRGDGHPDARGARALAAAVAQRLTRR
jgi:hypothetical protein